MSDFKLPNVVKQDVSIVPILTSQRDRYKQRFEESHRNCLDLSAKLSNVNEQMQRIEQDNVILYEKLKYQESYSGSRAVSYVLTQHTGINIESHSRVTEKYKTMYEAKIDPFTQFKLNETQSKAMNPAERVAMLVTKILIGNKYSRIIFVVYSFALHCLVFFALYEVMAMESCVKKTPFDVAKIP